MVDNQQTTITSVALNPDDNRVLEITPSININSKSTALLSYDGMGGIKRLNDIAAPAFTNETVTLFLPNIANNAIYGFEDGGPDGSKLGNGIILVKFHLPTNKLLQDCIVCVWRLPTMVTGLKHGVNKDTNTENSNFTLEAGQNVTLEFKIWIDPSYTATNIQPHIWNAGNWVSEGFWTSVEGLDRGK